jgi:hypothetical protein
MPPEYAIWATQRLKEYIVKGFALKDERFKSGKYVRKSPVPLDISPEDIYSSSKGTETIRTRTMEDSHGDRTS